MAPLLTRPFKNKTKTQLNITKYKKQELWFLSFDDSITTAQLSFSLLKVKIGVLLHSRASTSRYQAFPAVSIDSEVIPSHGKIVLPQLLQSTSSKLCQNQWR